MSLPNMFAEGHSPTTPPLGGANHFTEKRNEPSHNLSKQAQIEIAASRVIGCSENRLSNILDRIGCGYIVLENRRRVLEANDTARQLLLREDGAVDTADGLTSAFKRLIGRAQTPLSTGLLSWVAVSRKGNAPIIFNRSAENSVDGVSSVILLDLEGHLAPNPLALQRMFGLTMAETRLALQMARGDAPAEIARSRCLSRTTVRSQLASIFSKTQTRRQADLVLLLARVAVLP